jgi:DNA mismatch endonuclease (patch repair protein)
MSAAKRSALMSRIRGRGTGPERVVEGWLSKDGIPYETHVRELPGRPDFVIPTACLVVLVDGDFWHGWRFPTWRDKLSPAWEQKIEANRTRDVRNIRKLRSLGWKVIRLWEHQIERAPDACITRIRAAVQRGTPHSLPG